MFIKETKSKRELKDFIMFPYKLYKQDPVWVPMLISDMKNMVIKKESILFKRGPHAFFVLYNDKKKAIGRIATAIDEKFNKDKKTNEGYITLFEVINDKVAAFLLFDTAISWLKQRRIKILKGPVSPTNGDDYRGLLTDNFKDPPVFLTSYNPEYYVQFFKNYGFKNYLKLFSFKYDLKKLPDRKLKRLIDLSKKRYKYEVYKANFKDLQGEAKDIKKILDLAMPDEWQDLTPPSYDEVLQMARNLKKFAYEETVMIARSFDGEPIGFTVAAPDYNQVLKKMNGRVFPFGWLKFLIYKRKITQGRAFVIFVIPQMRGKGVPAAMFYELFSNAKKLGYFMAEGSTIGEENKKMIQEAKSAGGVIYKTFEILKKEI